jgi:hypothetical protein
MVMLIGANKQINKVVMQNRFFPIVRLSAQSSKTSYCNEVSVNSKYPSMMYKRVPFQNRASLTRLYDFSSH